MFSNPNNSFKLLQFSLFSLLILETMEEELSRTSDTALEHCAYYSLWTVGWHELSVNGSREAQVLFETLFGNTP